MTVQIKLTAKTDGNIIALKEAIAEALEPLGVVSVVVTEVQPIQARLGDV